MKIALATENGFAGVLMPEKTRLLSNKREINECIKLREGQYYNLKAQEALKIYYNLLRNWGLFEILYKKFTILISVVITHILCFHRTPQKTMD